MPNETIMQNKVMLIYYLSEDTLSFRGNGTSFESHAQDP